MISGQTRIRDRSTGKVRTVSWTKDARKPGDGISAPGASAHEKEVLRQEADRARRDFSQLSTAEKSTPQGGRFVDGHYVADARQGPEVSRPQFEQSNLGNKSAQRQSEAKQPPIRNEGDSHKWSQGERREDKTPSNRPERDRMPTPSRERDPYGADRPQYPVGDGFGLPRGAGVYQLMSFPLTRFNGVALPQGMSIRFAEPSRWFQKGTMESRLFTIATKGKAHYAWDAHYPVGKTPHEFYHVNTKGMFSLFGQSDHAALTGAQLVQAKQLHYLKVGGSVFLFVGVAVDTVQMGQAAVQSYQQGSIKPVAAQAVRTAGSWATAWAGAKAGFFAGGLAGVQTGPGMVLTVIGGGLIGGTAGYLGADWIADWIHED